MSDKNESDKNESDKTRSGKNGSEERMTVAVLGGGSFGTAIASIAADNGAEVRQWLRDEALVEQINREHRNGRYLPDYSINPAVVASTDLAETVAEAAVVFIAIPSKAFRKVLQQARPYLRPEQILVSTTKGIEADGFKLMSQVIEEETGSSHIGALSGPNLAAEIAQKQLTATVIASDDPVTGLRSGGAGVLLFPRLRRQRSLRRRAGRLAEEHLRHRGRHGRRAGHGREHAQHADDPRAGGDEPVRRRARRQPDDLPGTLRRW